MTDKPRVFALIFESENNVLFSGSWCVVQRLNEAGLDAEIIDLKEQGKFEYMVKALAAGQISFCIGLQGVGSRLTANNQNLWSAAKVPFISLHFDHPSHMVYNHIAESPYIANIYHFQAFLDDYRDFVVPIRHEPRTCGLIPANSLAVERNRIPYRDREIRLFYIKTGCSLAPYEKHFNTLPKILREGVWDRLGEAEKNPNLSLCKLARSLFPDDGFMDPNNQVEYWAIVKAMDLYLRGQRAIKFVNWLKQQENALIIGDGWDEIDKTGCKARFMPSVDSSHSMLLYENAQIVCNTNPYARDMVHERIILGLLNENVVLTDTNEQLDTVFGNTPSVLRFDWAKPLEESLDALLSEADRHQDSLPEARELARSRYVNIDYVPEIVRYVEETRRFAAGG